MPWKLTPTVTLDRPRYAGVLRDAQEVVVHHDPADPRRHALFVP